MLWFRKLRSKDHLMLCVLCFWIILSYPGGTTFALQEEPDGAGHHRPISLSLDRGQVVVEAAGGPGGYGAKEPIRAIVQSHNKDWMLKITGDAPKLELENGRHTWSAVPEIPLENITLEIRRGGKTVQTNNLARGISFNPEGKGTETLDVFVTTETNWQTIAGTYGGKLIFTVMAPEN